MIKRAMMDLEGDLLQSRELWACLSCGLCSARCPVEIDFPEFIRTHRENARKEGNLPQETHNGILQTIPRLQTHGIKQDRTGWAKQAGKFKQTGEYFYFVGCLPYFDVTFRGLNMSALDSAISALGLLNKMGIEPVISNDECCCGHDALWSGDEDTFKKLAEINLAVIKSSGAKTVLFSCPEGYFAFKNHYPKYFGDLPFEVLHMTEFFSKELPAADLAFEPSSDGVVTFQDPCRLGRLSGNYESPRKMLQLIPELEFEEMGRTRENALCCGTSAWMECSGCSKAMQMLRLREALQTGAQTLITACPKCQIHFTCASNNEALDLKIIDIYTYLLEKLAGH
jgi:Fe-S oxidoreductase